MCESECIGQIESQKDQVFVSVYTGQKRSQKLRDKMEKAIGWYSRRNGSKVTNNNKCYLV